MEIIAVGFEQGLALSTARTAPFLDTIFSPDGWTPSCNSGHSITRKMVFITGDNICPLSYEEQEYIIPSDDELFGPVFPAGQKPVSERNEGGLVSSAEYSPCLEGIMGAWDSSSSHDTAESWSSCGAQTGSLPPSPVACMNMHVHTDNRTLHVDSSNKVLDAQLSLDVASFSPSKFMYLDAWPGRTENIQLVRPSELHHLRPKSMKVNEVPVAPAAAAIPETTQTAEAELQRLRMVTIINLDGDTGASFPAIRVLGTARIRGPQQRSARSVGPALSSVCGRGSVFEVNTDDGDVTADDVCGGDATDSEAAVYVTEKRQSSGSSCAAPSRSSAAAVDQASDAHVASVRHGGEELVNPVEPEVSSLPALSTHPQPATALVQGEAYCTAPIICSPTSERLQDMPTRWGRFLPAIDVEVEKQLEPPPKRPCRMRSQATTGDDMDVDSNMSDRGDEDDDDDYTLQPRCGGGARKSQTCQGRPPKNLVSGSVCIECGATWTPQWRTGPDGPRTLCNACGVRYGKLLKQQADNAQRMPRLRKRKNS